MRRLRYWAVFIASTLTLLSFLAVGCEPYLNEQEAMRYDFTELYTISGVRSGAVYQDRAAEAGSFFLYDSYWDETIQSNVLIVDYVSPGVVEIMSTSLSHPDVEFDGGFLPVHIPRHFILPGRVPDPNDNNITLSENLLLYRLNGSGGAVEAELIANKIVDAADFSTLPAIDSVDAYAVSGDRIYMVIIGQDGTLYEISYKIDETGFSDPREGYGSYLTLDSVFTATGVDIPAYSTFYTGNPLSLSNLFWPRPGSGLSSYFFTYTEQPSGTRHLYHVQYNGTETDVQEFTDSGLVSALTGFEALTPGRFIGEEYIALSREESWYGGKQQFSSLTLYSPGGEILGVFEPRLEGGTSLTYFGWLEDPVDGTVKLLFGLSKIQEEESVLYTLPIEEVLQ